MFSRREKLLKRIQPATQRGLEIGPLDRPIVSMQEGHVRYVDFATTDELRLQRANDPTVQLENLAPVHYVWGDKTLREAIGSDEEFDYVVASHVIEHVPDLVGWLKEIAQVLKPKGVVAFIVPDKRYTFDRLRPETQVAELVDSFLSRRRKPSFRQIFEHYAFHTRVDASQAHAGQILDSNLIRVHDNSYALKICEDAAQTGKYVDSHCWVFTPSSFLGLLRTLIEMELLNFRVVEFFPTHENEIDFFVTLERVGNDERAAQLTSLPKEFSGTLDVVSAPIADPSSPALPTGVKAILTRVAIKELDRFPRVRMALKFFRDRVQR